MSEIFSVDNALFRLMTRVCYGMLLGVLWLFTSLPVITIGASTTALNSVMLKMVRDEEGYITKSYFKAFVSNFKQATLLWIVLLLGMIIFAFDIFFFLRTGGVAGIFLTGVFVAAESVIAITLMVVFHYQAWFENPVKITMINSFRVSMGYLPYSIGLLFLLIMMGYAVYVSVPLMMIFFLFGAPFFSYISALLWRRIFDKLEIGREEN